MRAPQEEPLLKAIPFEAKKRRESLCGNEIAEIDVLSDSNVPVCDLFRIEIRRALSRQQHVYIYLLFSSMRKCLGEYTHSDPRATGLNWPY
jgi:hypothetical protein